MLSASGKVKTVDVLEDAAYWHETVSRYKKRRRTRKSIIDTKLTSDVEFVAIRRIPKNAD